MSLGHERNTERPAYVRLTGPSLDAANPPLNPPPDPARPAAACEGPEPEGAELIHQEGSAGAGARLVIALLLFVGLGVVGLFLALALDIVVPPILWIAMVAMLIVGVIAGGASEDDRRRPRQCDDGRAIGCCLGPRQCDDGRAIGCCLGPRPLRGFRDR